MKNKDLLEQMQDIELTKEQEEHIREYLGIKNRNRKWKPKYEDKYYFIDDWGDIDFNYFDINRKQDGFRLFNNNCFRTREDAEFKLEQIKVYNELKNFADGNNGEICWKDNDTLKYYIYYNYQQKGLGISFMIAAKYIGQIYFSSEELAKQAIEKVGANRIKKYLFKAE